jgi:hypothetical protein
VSDAGTINKLLQEGARADVIAQAFGITEQRVIELANWYYAVELPTWRAEQELINAKIRTAVRKAQKRQKAKDFQTVKDEELVFMRFDGMTYRAIAKQVQLSTERVRQRVQRYARRMNRGLRNAHFKVIHGEER